MRCQIGALGAWRSGTAGQLVDLAEARHVFDGDFDFQFESLRAPALTMVTGGSVDWEFSLSEFQSFVGELRVCGSMRLRELGSLGCELLSC